MPGLSDHDGRNTHLSTFLPRRLLVRLLNELITLTLNRSLTNDLYVQYHDEPKVDEKWRVGIRGFGEEVAHVIGAGAGLLDAMGQGIAALREEKQVENTTTRRRAKPRRRRAPLLRFHGLGEEEDISGLGNRYRGRRREAGRRTAAVAGARMRDFITGCRLEARADCANAR